MAFACHSGRSSHFLPKVRLSSLECSIFDSPMWSMIWRVVAVEPLFNFGDLGVFFLSLINSCEAEAGPFSGFLGDFLMALKSSAQHDEARAFESVPEHRPVCTIHRWFPHFLFEQAERSCLVHGWRISVFHFSSDSSENRHSSVFLVTYLRTSEGHL